MQLIRENSACIQMLLLLMIHVALAFELPHGVPHSKSSFYSFGKSFQCLDSSLLIPWIRVNDDYCDCADGSDEPGTAACRRGMFYCKDTQYKLRAIPAAYVKDGYCDCCDGSDEYGSGITCDSNCGVLAAAYQQAKSVKRYEVEEGHKLFKKYAEHLKIENAKLEQERALAKESTGLNPEHQTSDLNDVASSEEDSPNSSATKGQSEHLSPNAAKADPEKDVAYEKNDDVSIASGPNQQPEDLEQERFDDDQREPPQEPKDYGPEGIFQVLDNMEQCLEFSDQQYTYELCGLKEVFQRERSGNKISLGKWAGWGHSDDNQNIGNNYDLMVFKNGLTCWNGPPRSTKVFVHCGSSNELLSVAEPSRCEYVMNLRTFAACFEDPEVIFNRLHPDD